MHIEQLELSRQNATERPGNCAITELTRQALHNHKRRGMTMKISSAAQYENALWEIASFMNAFSDEENATDDNQNR